MTQRSVNLFKVIESYVKNKPTQFDSTIVFSKLKLISAEDGNTRSIFKVEKSMCNAGDTLHGGFIASCTDVMSTFAHLDHTGKIAWTMSLHLDYIAAAKIGEEVTVETTPIRKGSYPIIETKFLNESGGLVAKGATSLVNGNDKMQGVLKNIFLPEPKRL